MNVVEVKIGDLKPAVYNPRKLSKKAYKDLETSIKEFGMVDPLVVNSAEERKNIIIGGHQRFYILKNLGWETVPVVYINLPEEEKERELNLRLNKNLGEWDWDLLADFDEDLLKKAGFDADELAKLFQVSIPVDGEEDFPAEVMEENNFVLFVFGNIVDWSFIKENLKLKTVGIRGDKSQARGVGRVIDGKKLIELIEKANGTSTGNA